MTKGSYKKKSQQQYVLKREKVLSKVKSKIKTQKPKPRTKTLIEATTEPSTKALPPGKKATLHFKEGKISVTAKIRYETEKVDPLIKTAYVADGKVVNKRYIGPKKRVAWVDAEGKEHNQRDVKQMQVKEDGKMAPIKITKTSDLKLEPVPDKVMDDFHPHAWIEIWGETDEDNEGLRDVAWELEKKGKVGAVKKFSHGYGKLYVGFIRPVISKDGKHFVLEMMVSENKRKRRRWMATEPAKKVKAEEPEVPELW